MQHLSSRTLKPSRTQSFVDAWTSSLEDSRANLSATLESVKQLKILGISSHSSETEFESADPELFSSKMLKESSPQKQETENQFSNMSSEVWKKWVTEQRQEYSQRVKSQHLIRESGSSSLVWPTASVAGCVEGGVASNVEMTSTGFKATRESGISYGAKLRDAVETYEKNWATPIANDAKGSDYAGTKENPKAMYLGGQVKNWATPQTFDANNLVRTPEKLAQTRAEKNAGCMNLREQVHYPDMDHSRKAAKKNWPTPRAANPGSRPNGKGGKILAEEAKKNWPTPAAHEPRLGYQNRNNGKKGTQKSLTTVVVETAGQQDQANPSTSGKSQESQGKLNPNWVEQLMGLPVGWTDLGFWATESSQLPQPKPSSPSSKG